MYCNYSIDDIIGIKEFDNGGLIITLENKERREVSISIGSGFQFSSIKIEGDGEKYAIKFVPVCKPISWVACVNKANTATEIFHVAADWPGFRAPWIRLATKKELSEYFTRVLEFYD